MDYKVEVRTEEAVRVACIRYKGLAAEANKVFPKVFMAVKGRVSGAPFFNFHKMDPATGIGEMDLCVPTAEQSYTDGIEIKELPAMEAVCTTHVGPYETIKAAYAAVEAYAAEHKLQLDPPFREVYIKGPGAIMKGNPETYITEIVIPFRA